MLIEIPEELEEKLSELGAESGSISKIEVLINSIALYSHVMKHKAMGHNLGIIKDDRIIKEIIL